MFLKQKMLAGSRGRAPGQGSVGRSPPEAERFSALECPKEAAILVLSVSFENSRKLLIFADVSLG